jgi:hypothetical protein
MHAFRLTTELHSSKEYNSRQMISMNSELCICVASLDLEDRIKELTISNVTLLTEVPTAQEMIVEKQHVNSTEAYIKPNIIQKDSKPFVKIFNQRIRHFLHDIYRHTWAFQCICYKDGSCYIQIHNICPSHLA